MWAKSGSNTLDRTDASSPSSPFAGGIEWGKRSNVFDPLLSHTYFLATNFPLFPPSYPSLTTNVQTTKSPRLQVQITSNFRKWIKRSFFPLRIVYSLQLRLLTIKQSPIFAKPQIFSMSTDLPSKPVYTAVKVTILPTSVLSAFLLQKKYLSSIYYCRWTRRVGQ